MQKVAIVSDIHGNIPALEQVAADIQRRQVDCVFNLGDHVSGPLWPKETIQYLMRQNWFHIRGNHDRQLVEQNPKLHGLTDRYAFQCLSAVELDWLRALPASLEPQDGLLVFHGAPASDKTYLLETVEHGRARLATPTEIMERLDGVRSPILICGHTHIPRVVEAPGEMLIINPGSVGLPAYDDEMPEYHVMETGSPHARYAILEHVEGRWAAELIAIPYEFQKAAEQSRKNNRPDWEIALLTGYMQ
ncbi:MAG: metallophosphatase family protein [Anaerolineaceae bacterium]|nr:metallophosphatase family protein [Anaerolineaceae bacterium]